VEFLMGFNANDFVYLKGTIKRYRLSCDSCGCDRGYGMKSRSNMRCKRCSHAGKDYIGKRTEEYRQKMSLAKKGQIPKNKSNISDSHRRLRHNISSLMGHYLSDRRYINNKTSKLKYLEFSIVELKDHLESKFQPGMSWDNYGRKLGKRCWHIDQAIPDSWFDYNDPYSPEFNKCWSLANLQPKWEDENIAKSNRYEDHI